MQEPVLASPAAAPPLHLSDEAPWTGGERPPHGADNGDHVRLDSLQVQTLMEDERVKERNHLHHSYCRLSSISSSIVPLPRMQRCTRPVSMLWGVTSSSSTITSPSTPPFPCRCTLTGGGSGRVRAPGSVRGGGQRRPARRDHQ